MGDINGGKKKRKRKAHRSRRGGKKRSKKEMREHSHSSLNYFIGAFKHESKEFREYQSFVNELRSIGIPGIAEKPRERHLDTKRTAATETRQKRRGGTWNKSRHELDSLSAEIKEGIDVFVERALKCSHPLIKWDWSLERSLQAAIDWACRAMGEEVEIVDLVLPSFGSWGEAGWEIVKKEESN